MQIYLCFPPLAVDKNTLGRKIFDCTHICNPWYSHSASGAFVSKRTEAKASLELCLPGSYVPGQVTLTLLTILSDL